MSVPDPIALNQRCVQPVPRDRPEDLRSPTTQTDHVGSRRPVLERFPSPMHRSGTPGLAKDFSERYETLDKDVRRKCDIL